MKNFLILICTIALTLCATNLVQAGSWYSQRSSYSHSKSRSYPTGMDRFARGTYRTPPRGASYRSGYRHIHSHINIRGHSYDHIDWRETWFQYGSEF